MSEPARVAQLDLFAKKIADLTWLLFVGGRELHDPLTDMHADFLAAHWNMATGYYKTAAASLRSALDIGVVGLYFVLTSYVLKRPEHFQGWDWGEIETSDWGKRKEAFKQSGAFTAFNTAYHCDVVDLVYTLYRLIRLIDRGCIKSIRNRKH